MPSQPKDGSPRWTRSSPRFRLEHTITMSLDSCRGSHSEPHACQHFNILALYHLSLTDIHTHAHSYPDPVTAFGRATRKKKSHHRHSFISTNPLRDDPLPTVSALILPGHC